MSKYTTEIRFLCESLAGYTEQQGYGSIEDILNVSAPLLFDFDFPIFDEDYRLELEKKILRHYYTREISEETVGLWKLRLSDRLNMIMPYYNQLYASELIEFDPMTDTSLETTSNTKTKKTDEGETHGGTTTIYEETTEKSEIGDESGSFSEQTSMTGNKNTSGTSSDSSTSESSSQNKRVIDEDTTEDSSRTIRDEESYSDTTTTTTTTSDTATNTYETGKSIDKSSDDAYSDTPQGTLENVYDMAYLTTARVINESTGEDENGSSTTIDDSSGEVVVNADGSSDKTETDSFGKTGTKDSSIVDNGSAGEEVWRETAKDETVEYGEDGTKSGSSSATKDTNTSGSKDSTTTVTNNGSTSGTSKAKQDYVQNIAGKRSLSSFSKYLIEFRQTFLNIDNMIINELSDLFINLW